MPFERLTVIVSPYPDFSVMSIGLLPKFTVKMPDKFAPVALISNFFNSTAAPV